MLRTLLISHGLSSSPFPSERLSGKKVLNLRNFSMLFRILESCLSVVRVRPQAADHPLDGGDLHPRLAGRRVVLVVLAQAPAAVQAGQPLLGAPAQPDRHEALLVLALARHFQPV